MILYSSNKAGNYGHFLPQASPSASWSCRHDLLSRSCCSLGSCPCRVQRHPQDQIDASPIAESSPQRHIRQRCNTGTATPHTTPGADQVPSTIPHLLPHHGHGSTAANMLALILLVSTLAIKSLCHTTPRHNQPSAEIPTTTPQERHSTNS